MTFNKVSIFVLLVLAIHVSNSYHFPLYKQCAEPWGNITMGVAGNGEQASICQEGCAMSDVSMALAGLNLTINGSISNPETLNSWLQQNSGYICIDDDCNNLQLWTINNVSKNHLRVTNPVNLTYPTLYDIRRGLDAQDTIFIAHNPSKQHFVLFKEPADWTWMNETFIDNDPYYNTTTYTFNETYGYIQYNIFGIARNYPNYTNCNSSWANITMGEGNGQLRICNYGSYLSCISMAMAAYNIPILDEWNQNVTTTPKTLNYWMETHNGYNEGTSDLNEDALNLIPNKRVIWNQETDMILGNKISFDKIGEYTRNHPRKIVIANYYQRFVLVTYTSGNNTLHVHDPTNTERTISYGNVLGYRLFNMA